MQSPPNLYLWEERPFPAPEKSICGTLGAYGDGGHVLLDGVGRTDFAFSDDRADPQSYEADVCITKDSPFNADFDLANFHHLRIELVGLEEWLKLDNIQMEDKCLEGSNHEVSVKYKDHSFSYGTPDGTITIESLTLGANSLGLFYGRLLREASFRQTHWLIYTPALQSSIRSLRIIFTQMEEFLALLLGSYFRLNWPVLVQGTDVTDPWLRLYFFRGSVPEFKPIESFLLTTFDVLQTSFGDLFSAYKAQSEKYRAAYYLYLAALRNPLPYPEHEFVNMVWALESFHRVKQSRPATFPSERMQRILDRFADARDKSDRKWLKAKLKYAEEPSLEDRIVDTFSALPLELDEKGLRDFAKRCAQRRNQISHEGGPGGEESYEDFCQDVRRLTEAFSYLYHALLLHEIDLGAKTLIRGVTNSVLGNMRTLPAFRRVGLSMPRTAE
jgi:hypothetical protein